MDIRFQSTVEYAKNNFDSIVTRNCLNSIFYCRHALIRLISIRVLLAYFSESRQYGCYTEINIEYRHCEIAILSLV
jgi:hypothetical protein